MTVISIPKIAKFGNKKVAAIREYTYVVFPPGSDSNILPNSTFRMNPTIPKGNTLKCIYGPNSYGTFQVCVSGAISNNWLDGSANCFFSKISTQSGSNELETFNYMNIYIPCVYNFCWNALTRNTFYSFFGNANYNTFFIAAKIDYLAQTRLGQPINCVVAGSYYNFAFIVPTIIG